MAVTILTYEEVDSAFCELAIRAAQTIREHYGCDGTCAVCGTHSPCDQAVLAAHNLELTSVAVQLPTTDGADKGRDSCGLGTIVAEG